MGDSCGCESIAIKAKLKSEGARAKGLQEVLVVLELKIAHNTYKRAAA